MFRSENAPRSPFIPSIQEECRILIQRIPAAAISKNTTTPSATAKLILVAVFFG